MVKVSVVMPVLNGGEYFEDALESVRNQSLRDIEILVVDAGSTDQTLAIVDKYMRQDTRIKLIHSDKKSMGRQYNLGIENATGICVGFVEADDYVVESMFSNLFNLLDEEKLEYIKTDYSFFVEKGKKVFLKDYVLPKGLSGIYNKTIMPEDYPQIAYTDIHMWNGLYEREFLNNNNIRLSETPGASFQDTGFVLQTLIHAKKVKYVSVDSYYYRQDNSSSSIYNHNVTRFVLQELQYAQKYMTKDLAREIELTALERMLRLYCILYRQSQAYAEIDLDQNREAVVRVIEEWKKWMSDYRVLKLGLERDLEFQSLIHDEVFFDVFQKKVYRLENERKASYYEKICNHNDIVIFGAGRIGQSCLASLIGNDIRKARCFVDNNESLRGRVIMELPIISFEEAHLRYPDALYILAIGDGHSIEGYRQLEDLGIAESNICVAFPVSSHAAFGTRLSAER